MKLARILLCICLLFGTSSCVIIRNTSVETMTAQEAIGTNVRSPLKAFHIDGTISVFASGARVTPEAVVGRGLHYSLDQADSTAVTSVPLDSVMGIEAFRGGVNPVSTILLSAVATVGSVALFKAIFGSCPTIYTYVNGEEVLHAEAFSYSIAPLLEARDVDLLAAQPENGRLRLEVRNEALETHYINHLEILEARHAPGRRALPNTEGRIVTVGAAASPSGALDRDGRDQLPQLLESDGVAYRSTEERMAGVTGDDPWDFVELTFPRPAGDSAALVLRMRNSLLNSVLFYDLMLASRGAEALDWMGRDINRISEAVELGRWYTETFGMRVSVLGDDGWEQVGRVGDSGPIAWKELAVPIPVPDTDEVRVRLTFLADEWRIDQVELAEDPVRVGVAAYQASSVAPISGSPDDGLRQKLTEPDEDYLVTTAGTAVFVDFDLPELPAGEERTLFLSSQGYYTEWMRPDWIRSGAATEGFAPSDGAVVELMDRWLAQRDDFEDRFYATRIPVR